jgi:hypothetical protein
MRRISLFLAILFGTFLLAAALSAQAPPAGASGHWEGTLEVPDQPVTVAIDLAKSDKGEWTGSLAVPERGLKGLKLDKIAVDGASVKFVALGVPGDPEFSGSLKADGKLSLTASVGGGSFALEMTRKGDAKVEVAKPEPAVDARLEGDWDGNLDAPDGGLHTVLHFHNQPDKTVKATLDSPDQNTLGFPLSDIVVKESAVEFQIRLVGGSFKGALNADATELRGEWSQNGATMPLTVKKLPAK